MNPLALTAGFSLRSPIPRQGKVSSNLQFPLVSGDIVVRMENGVYSYYAFHAGNWTPSEPAINVGEGFWINRSTDWKLNTSIWP